MKKDKIINELDDVIKYKNKIDKFVENIVNDLIKINPTPQFENISINLKRIKIVNSATTEALNNIIKTVSE